MQHSCNMFHQVRGFMTLGIRVTFVYDFTLVSGNQISLWSGDEEKHLQRLAVSTPPLVRQVPAASCGLNSSLWCLKVQQKPVHPGLLITLTSSKAADAFNTTSSRVNNYLITVLIIVLSVVQSTVYFKTFYNMRLNRLSKLSLLLVTKFLQAVFFRLNRK